MKLARPSFLLGALFVLAAVVVFRGLVPLEPRTIWTVFLVVPGIGFLFFGLTVAMAGRVLVAAMNTPEDERPAWDDDDDADEDPDEDPHNHAATPR